jgi:hypothetical protein
MNLFFAILAMMRDDLDDDGAGCHIKQGVGAGFQSRRATSINNISAHVYREPRSRRQPAVTPCAARTIYISTPKDLI